MRAKEEHAVILDFLPNGYPFDKRPIHRKTPIAQALGKNSLVLLELVPKPDVFLQPLEEVYIGEGKRDKIHHISARIQFDKLTGTGKSELEFVIKDSVLNDEQRFIKFFNTAGAINMRVHQLELLPGIGKRHMLEILEKREDKDFESFKDLKERVSLLPNPEKAIIKRVMLEIEGNEKHYLFVKG
jgi:putative nucleotide binding protein